MHDARWLRVGKQVVCTWVHGAGAGVGVGERVAGIRLVPLPVYVLQGGGSAQV